MSNVKARTKNVGTAMSTDMVRTYLHEIGRVPLLTHEQEILFGKQVQQMMLLYEAKEALAESLDREPTLEEWAQKANLRVEDLEVTLARGQRAKQKMIEPTCD